MASYLPGGSNASIQSYMESYLKHLTLHLLFLIPMQHWLGVGMPNLIPRNLLVFSSQQTASLPPAADFYETISLVVGGKEKEHF